MRDIFFALMIQNQAQAELNNEHHFRAFPLLGEVAA